MRITKIFILIATVLFLFHYRIDNLNGEAKDRNFEKQLGVYKIDITRTNFIDYLEDSVLYKDLTITFNHDSSFYFNKNVPFIIGESGTWITGGEGIEIWNTMFFGKNKKYFNMKKLLIMHHYTLFLIKYKEKRPR